MVYRYMYIYPSFFLSDLPVRLLSPDRRRVLPYSFDLTPDLRDPVSSVYCVREVLFVARRAIVLCLK